MPKVTVRIQVIRVYDVEVEAPSNNDALDIVEKMSTTEIAERGTFIDVETDYAEVQ